MAGRRVLVIVLPLALAAACSRFSPSDDPVSGGDAGTDGKSDDGSGGLDGDGPDGSRDLDDAAGSDGASSDGSSDGGATTGARNLGFCDGGYAVFVSSTSWNATGGTAAADQVCQGDGLSGFGKDTYRAWISDSTKSALARLKSNGPFCRPDGKLVAANKMALKTGLPSPTLAGKINMEASRATVTVGVVVWTGTAGSGLRSGSNDCNGWTGTGAGTYGEPEAYDTSQWTDYSAGGCGVSNPVVCFADDP